MRTQLFVRKMGTAHTTPCSCHQNNVPRCHELVRRVYQLERDELGRTRRHKCISQRDKQDIDSKHGMRVGAPLRTHHSVLFFFFSVVAVR